MNLFAITIFLLVGILQATANHAQVAGESGCPFENSDQKNSDQILDAEKMQSWKRVKFGKASVCVPGEMVFTKGLAYDIGYWEFKDIGLTIRIYAGTNAPQVTDRSKQFATYSESVAWINGYPALVTKHRDDDGNLRYIYKIRVGSSTNIDSYAMTIVVRSEKESVVFAERLFSTVLFDPTLIE